MNKKTMPYNVLGAIRDVERKEKIIREGKKIIIAKCNTDGCNLAKKYYAEGKLDNYNEEDFVNDLTELITQHYSSSSFNSSENIKEFMSAAIIGFTREKNRLLNPYDITSSIKKSH